MKEQKKIEQHIDTLNAKALTNSIGKERLQSTQAILLDGIGQKCDSERIRLRRAASTRQSAISVLSCVVIILCFYYLLPHSNQCRYAIDGHFANHTSTINVINSVFDL
jgi:hypothetical protein